jgi:hypothetical protein
LITADVVLRVDRSDVVCGDVILKDDDVALIVCVVNLINIKKNMA